MEARGAPLTAAGPRVPDAALLGALDVQLDQSSLDRLDELTAPSLGFPHDFLASDMVRAYSTSGHDAELDNHRALAAGRAGGR